MRHGRIGVDLFFRPVAKKLFVDHLFKFIDSKPIDCEFDAGLCDALSFFVLSVEDSEDRFTVQEVIFDRHELAQGFRHDRLGGQSATNDYLESTFTVSDSCDQSDIVHQHHRLVFFRTGKCNLRLSWHVLRGRVPQEITGIGRCVRSYIEYFVF